MNSVVASVVSVSGSSAKVSVDASQACPRCAAGKGCGAGLFADSTRRAEIDVDLPPDVQFQAGDRVTVSLSSTSLLRASMLAYGLPLGGGLGLLTLGGLMVNPLGDVLAIGLTVTGLAIGFAIGRRQMRRESCVREFVPAVTDGPHAS